MRKKMLIFLALISLIATLAISCLADEAGYIHNPITAGTPGSSSTTPIYVVGSYSLYTANISEQTSCNLTGILVSDGSHVYALPLGSGNIVFTDSIQALTNKTLGTTDMTGNLYLDGSRLYLDSGDSSCLYYDAAGFYLDGSSKVMQFKTSNSNTAKFITTATGVDGCTFTSYHNSSSQAQDDVIFKWLNNARLPAEKIAVQQRAVVTHYEAGNNTMTYYWDLLQNDTLNNAMYLEADGTLYVDADYQTFDSYDDALLLARGIRDKDVNALIEAGVVEPKYRLDAEGKYLLENGHKVQDGYALNTNKMFNLLAGGIYQSRDKIDEFEARIEALERRK